MQESQALSRCPSIYRSRGEKELSWRVHYRCVTRTSSGKHSGPVDGAVKTPENASLLRSKTHLCAERKNATRWWSIYKMLKKWIRLKEYILQVESFPESVIENIPTAVEQPRIAQLIASLSDFESVAKSFKFAVDKQQNQEDGRVLFDSLLEAYPAKVDALRPYLAAGAPIVNNPNFENALVKIQGGKESELTKNAKFSVRIFKRRDASPTVPEA